MSDMYWITVLYRSCIPEYPLLSLTYTLFDFATIFPFTCGLICRSPWLHPDFIYYMTKEGKQFKRNCDYVHQVAEDVINKRRQEIVGLIDDYGWQDSVLLQLFVPRIYTNF
jgi:hypothetical protein